MQLADHCRIVLAQSLIMCCCSVLAHLARAGAKRPKLAHAFPCVSCNSCHSCRHMQSELTLPCRSLYARNAEASSCAKQAAATRRGTPEGVLMERAEVVHLYRSPGLSASAAAALLRRVRRHRGRTRRCMKLPQRMQAPCILQTPCPELQPEQTGVAGSDLRTHALTASGDLYRYQQQHRAYMSACAACTGSGKGLCRHRRH